MDDILRHPGADPVCKICRGRGLAVEQQGEIAVAVACVCLRPCPICQGAGFVRPTTSLRDAASLKQFRAPVRRCDCVRAEARKRVFDDAKIPGRYWAATLASFDKKNAPQAEARANAYASSFKVGEPHRGLVFHGPVGRGKTHLMVALLRELILRYGVTARFVEFSHLLSDIKFSFDRGGTADIVEPLATVDILAIDELGKGRNTEFEGTVIDEIVTRRYNAGRTILGTSNYATGPATGRAAPNPAEDDAQRVMPTLVDRVGERVYSRLRETTDFVEMKGEDFRELLAHKARRR
jgi:DNA replication protein DnaC